MIFASTSSITLVSYGIQEYLTILAGKISNRPLETTVSMGPTKLFILVVKILFGLFIRILGVISPV